jgi:hypothetical protein
MHDDQLKQLAKQFLEGDLSGSLFLQQLSSQGKIADTGDAQLDLERNRRCGFPEVVFAEGKSAETLRRIFHSLTEHGVDVLATRLTADKAEVLLPEFPRGNYNAVGHTFRIPLASNEDKPPSGRVTLVTAGTSDLPVAEEARETAVWAGAEVTMVQDVGVAGPHRLRANLHVLEGADAIIVTAGMEGALPSVVGGYVDCPVIAVPTSVGYGASFGGLAALLGMLNSCASNVTVVNIDAGFKGGYLAGLIARNVGRARANRTD